jgi:hypothetical protein
MRSRWEELLSPKGSRVISSEQLGDDDREKCSYLNIPGWTFESYSKQDRTLTLTLLLSLFNSNYPGQIGDDFARHDMLMLLALCHAKPAIILIAKKRSSERPNYRTNATL